MMTVNHGGFLTEEYFRAYLSLVMNSRNCTLETAKDFMVTTFFKGDLSFFVPVSYASFINAFKSMAGN